MLTPARPQKDDPMYQEKMKRYRQDLEDKQHHPRNWGMVQGETAADAAPARRGRPRKEAGQ